MLKRDTELLLNNCHYAGCSWQRVERSRRGQDSKSFNSQQQH